MSGFADKSSKNRIMTTTRAQDLMPTWLTGGEAC
jgi:hypothetical protein